MLFACCMFSVLCMHVFLVEMQGLRDSRSPEILVAMDISQETGRTRRKSRKRNKASKTSGGDISGEEGGIETQRSQSRDDGEDREVFEVKRYPAYHYDTYGTIVSLTDGVRPSTLERDTIKSASADYLDVLNESPRPAERLVARDDVALAQPSSVASEQQRKPKPKPRTKPAAKHASASSKSVAAQPGMKSAGTDPAFVEELSSLLKQRNQ